MGFRYGVKKYHVCTLKHGLRMFMGGLPKLTLFEQKLCCTYRRASYNLGSFVNKLLDKFGTKLNRKWLAQIF